MQRRFVTYLLLFFIPIVLGYAVVEYFTLQLPSNFKELSEYMQREKNSFEVLIFGSSQMQGGINPQYINKKTLNLATGNQHHDTDFKLLRQLLPKLPEVETVVLEVSYSHFELPHNGKNFWKNNSYLKYLGVNAFERHTYFKDRLIYLSHPEIFSKKLIKHYIEQDLEFGYNQFAYDTLKYEGLFKDLNYNEVKISEQERFKINKIPNLELFETNTSLFFKMLDFLEDKKLNVVLCHAPMYKTYLPQRVPEILNRRDSIVDLALMRYPNITLLDLEEDTLNYSVKDFWNQSHVNPRGGKKFSEALNELLNSLD